MSNLNIDRTVRLELPKELARDEKKLNDLKSYLLRLSYNNKQYANTRFVLSAKGTQQ